MMTRHTHYIGFLMKYQMQSTTRHELEKEDTFSFEFDVLDGSLWFHFESPRSRDTWVGGFEKFVHCFGNSIGQLNIEHKQGLQKITAIAYKRLQELNQKFEEERTNGLKVVAKEI